MARGYRLLSGRNRLIPRISVEGRHRVWKKTDPDDPFENGSVSIDYEQFTAEECVIQPMNGKANKDLNVQLGFSGEEDYDSCTVYSETLLLRAREGTNELSDQLLLPTTRGESTWFTVMKADRFVSAGVNRYRYYMIAIPAGTEGGV